MSKKKWSEDQLEANRLKHVEGLSLNEVAKRMKKPLSFVNKWVRPLTDYTAQLR